MVFGCDHKTVREHALPVESYLRNAPLSKPPPKPDHKARGYSGLAQHFILFALLEANSLCTNDLQYDGWARVAFRRREIIHLIDDS
jgi:hypothetical protein